MTIYDYSYAELLMNWSELVCNKYPVDKQIVRLADRRYIMRCSSIKDVWSTVDATQYISRLIDHLCGIDYGSVYNA